MAVGSQFFIEHDLRNACAVAQVEEDQIAVIAAAIDPAHHDHRLTSVGGAQLTAEMCSFEIT
jgi:hypothetical protein